MFEIQIEEFARSYKMRGRHKKLISSRVSEFGGPTAGQLAAACSWKFRGTSL